MNGQQLLDAIALADPAYIEAAEALPAPKQTAPARKSAAPVRWLALAACLCLVIGVAGMVLTNPPFVHVGPTEPPQTAPAGTTAPSGTAEPVLPRFSSVEALVEAALAGELGSEIPGLEYFYAPTAEFPGYWLHNIGVCDWNIQYTYVPTGSSASDWSSRNMIYAFYLLESSKESLGLFVGEDGLEKTPEGYLYHPEQGVIAFEVGSTWMIIDVPDSMNDYELLKTFCTARRVEIPGGAALDTAEANVT